MTGNLGQILKHILDFTFSNPLDEILKALITHPIGQIATRQAENHFRNPSGRNRTYG